MELYTIQDIIELFPRCTEAMVRNYRHKTGIGRWVDGIVYYTADEVTKFVEDTEFLNIARRTVIYEYLKHHPGTTERELQQVMPYSKIITSIILADISMPEYMRDYNGLYEDDNGRLFVEGCEHMNPSRRFSRKEGFFHGIRGSR